MNKRNYGIDVLRILSTYMVLILHILYKGGILNNVSINSTKYWSVWYLEICSYVAVNCFAIISGYVMSLKNIKLSKCFLLWLEVLFYSVLITVIINYLKPELFNLKELIKAFFPISSNQYWYITAYFGMCFFIPFFNRAIFLLEKEVFKRNLIAILIAMSIFPTILNAHPFNLQEGYSVVWLSVLYLVGAYLKKFYFNKIINTRICLSLFFFMATVTLFSKYIFEVFFNYSGNYLIAYNSPTIVIMSIVLILLFQNLKINKKLEKIVKIFSSTALSVYIIHCHPLIMEYIIKDFAIIFIQNNTVVLIILVLCIALLILIFLSVLDLLRIKLFMIFKIDVLCENIEKYFKNLRI